MQKGCFVTYLHNCCGFGHFRKKNLCQIKRHMQTEIREGFAPVEKASPVDKSSKPPQTQEKSSSAVVRHVRVTLGVEAVARAVQKRPPAADWDVNTKNAEN